MHLGQLQTCFEVFLIRSSSIELLFCDERIIHLRKDSSADLLCLFEKLPNPQYASKTVILTILCAHASCGSLKVLTQRAYRITKFSCFNFNFYHHLQSKEGVKPKYDEENLVYVINDLFLGGSETSSTTLYWGLLYMVLNPDIQGESGGVFLFISIILY